MRTSDCCFKSLSLGRFLTQHCIVTEVTNTVKVCKYLWGFGLICFGLTLPELRKAIWRGSGNFSRRDLSGWQGALASWESRRDEGKPCSLSGPSSEATNTKGSCPRPSAGGNCGRYEVRSVLQKSCDSPAGQNLGWRPWDPPLTLYRHRSPT